MRIKLSEKFQNEREDICNKIITILKLKEDNTFLLCDFFDFNLFIYIWYVHFEEIMKYFLFSIFIFVFETHNNL